LRESEARYRALHESANDAILLLRNRRVVDCNRRAEEMLHLTRDEILGRSPLDFSPERQPDGAESASLIEARIEAVRAGDRQVFAWQCRRPDGTTFHTEVSLNRVEVGDESFFLAIIRDVSSRKRAELEHQRLEEQLHQVQKMEAVGQLAGGIAHDFNNLLQAIRGYSDLALGDLPSDSTLSEYLRQIRRAVDRANTLTRQLLSFSRRQPLQPRLLNVGDLLGDLMNIVRRLLGERIELVVDAAESPRSVYADPGQIEQIVLNLCLNARDAMPDGGHISIELQNVTLDESYRRWRPEAVPGDYVRLRVRDDGRGIPADLQDRVFEPFFTTKAVGDGSGMGLATVYAIVKRHHGLLDLRDRPQWKTVKGGSHQYVKRMLQDLGPRVRSGDPVISVARGAREVLVTLASGERLEFDHVVLACHADESLAMLADPLTAEREILSGFAYQPNRALLHTDERLMPVNRRVWSSWNYLAAQNRDRVDSVSVTYWMNRLQGLSSDRDYFVSLNPLREPRPGSLIAEMTYHHPVFDREAMKMQERLPEIQGKDRIWYTGSYFGYGFHEDALRASVDLAGRFGVRAPWLSDDDSSAAGFVR